MRLNKACAYFQRCRKKTSDWDYKMQKKVGGPVIGQFPIGEMRVGKQWTPTKRRVAKKRAVDQVAKKAHPIIDYNKRTCAVIPKYTSRFIVSTRSTEPMLLARPTVAARERDDERSLSEVEEGGRRSS